MDIHHAYQLAVAAGNLVAAQAIWETACLAACERAVQRACSAFGVPRLRAEIDASVPFARAYPDRLVFNPAKAELPDDCLTLVALHELGHVLIPGATETQADIMSGVGARVLGLDFAQCYQFVHGLPQGMPHPAGPQRALAFAWGWWNPDWGRAVVARWKERVSARRAATGVVVGALAMLALAAVTGDA